jgi:uncharacterized protein YraI
MQRIQRVWRGSLVGKVVLILAALLGLLLIVGIPVGVISLLSNSSRAASAPDTMSTPDPTVLASIQVTIYPSPTGPPEPTTPPTDTPASTTTSAPSPEASAAITPALTPEAAIVAQLTVTDTNDYVNVRSSPGLTANILGRLNKGQNAPITGKSQDGLWWQINFNGQPGWVYAPVARVSGNTSAVPVIQVPGATASTITTPTATIPTTTVPATTVPATTVPTATARPG